MKAYSRTYRTGRSCDRSPVGARHRVHRLTLCARADPSTTSDVLRIDSAVIRFPYRLCGHATHIKLKSILFPVSYREAPDVFLFPGVIVPIVNSVPAILLFLPNKGGCFHGVCSPCGFSTKTRWKRTAYFQTKIRVDRSLGGESMRQEASMRSTEWRRREELRLVRPTHSPCRQLRHLTRSSASRFPSLLARRRLAFESPGCRGGKKVARPEGFEPPAA